MQFEDLKGGISPHQAIEAMLEGCKRKDTLFAPESWRNERFPKLINLLSNPVTEEQAEALRGAILRQHPVDTVIRWLENNRGEKWTIFRSGDAEACRMAECRRQEEDLRRQRDTVRDTFVELRTLIEKSNKEAHLQAFLEANPFLVCDPSHRGPVNSLIIAQFPLGLDFRADFAYVTSGATEGTWFHLVEIERPKLPIFTAKDEFSQEFNHACQQLQDWSFWCVNNRDFLRHILAPILGDIEMFNVSCRLIAGRRTDVTNNKRQSRLIERANYRPVAFKISTWDGFIERLEASTIYLSIINPVCNLQNPGIL